MRLLHKLPSPLDGILCAVSSSTRLGPIPKLCRVGIAVINPAIHRGDWSRPHAARNRFNGFSIWECADKPFKRFGTKSNRALFPAMNRGVNDWAVGSWDRLLTEIRGPAFSTESNQSRPLRWVGAGRTGRSWDAAARRWLGNHPQRKRLSRRPRGLRLRRPRSGSREWLGWSRR